MSATAENGPRPREKPELSCCSAEVRETAEHKPGCIAQHGISCDAVPLAGDIAKVRKKRDGGTAIEEREYFSPSIEMLISDLYVSIWCSTCLGAGSSLAPLRPTRVVLGIAPLVSSELAAVCARTPLGLWGTWSLVRNLQRLGSACAPRRNS